MIPYEWLPLILVCVSAAMVIAFRKLGHSTSGHDSEMEDDRKPHKALNTGREGPVLSYGCEQEDLGSGCCCDRQCSGRDERAVAGEVPQLQGGRYEEHRDDLREHCGGLGRHAHDSTAVVPIE